MIKNILENLNQRFDHAALKPEIAETDIIKLCEEAIQWQFYAIAVNPVWVKTAKLKLTGSKVKIVTVSGFPLGASTTDVKILEAAQGVCDGANEIDMVANIGWLADDDFIKAEKEIAEIRKSLPFNIILKVIIETDKLTEKQQIDAVKAVINGGAQFVKTGTGFFGSVTTGQVKRLYRIAKSKVEIKASGGIRTLKQCRQLLEAGAVRIGSSSSVTIMNQL